MWRVHDENRETVHTWIAVLLIGSGIAAFFVDLLWIHGIEGVDGGTLAYIGEAFALAGGLLGIVQYVNGRLGNFERRFGGGGERGPRECGRVE